MLPSLASFSGCFLFGERGAMRRTRGCLGNTPTFLAVCKKCSRRFLCTGDAEHGPPGSTHSYPDWAAFPAAFFIACGQPNQERSSPPLLTVYQLLTGGSPGEVGGVKNEMDETPEVPTPQGSFYDLSVEDIWETWLQKGITETPLPVPYRRTERINLR